MNAKRNLLSKELPDSCFSAPPFWVGGLEECHDFMRRLPGIDVIEVGRSAGGRPILAGCYGAQEPLDRTSSSLSSSMAALGDKAWNVDAFYPPSFYGKNRREKPVLVFQGNMHGSEISGTVAAMNLLHLLVHGVDLRGREHARLRAYASRMRIVVIPHANPDGRARWEPAKHLETVSHAVQQRVTQGWLPDGTALTWPSCKQFFPIPPGGCLGAYYTDAGVNLNHDRFLDADRAPETDALLKFYLQEMPDVVIAGHGDQGTLVSAPPCYVPEEIQGLTFRMAGAVAAEIRRQGLPIFSYPHGTRAGGGSRVFNQLDAIYHQCGALPLLAEFPTSVDGHRLDFDRILDVGLCVFETLAAWGDELGFCACLRKHLADGRVVTSYGPLGEKS